MRSQTNVCWRSLVPSSRLGPPPVGPFPAAKDAAIRSLRPRARGLGRPRAFTVFRCGSDMAAGGACTEVGRTYRLGFVLPIGRQTPPVVAFVRFQQDTCRQASWV